DLVVEVTREVKVDPEGCLAWTQETHPAGHLARGPVVQLPVNEVVTKSPSHTIGINDKDPSSRALGGRAINQTFEKMKLQQADTANLLSQSYLSSRHKGPFVRMSNCGCRRDLRKRICPSGKTAWRES